MNNQKTAWRVSLAALLPLLLFSFFTRLSCIPVRIWDEARNANNAVAIYLHGHWLVPYYQGSPDMWNTKPPLLIWLQVLCMHLFGTGELALRIPSAIAATLTGLLLWYWLGRKLQRPWAGFLAGAVLATTYAYVDNHGGRTGDYDTLMVLFMTAATFSCFNWLHQPQKKWLWLFWIFLALAVLTKGVAGLTLLPGLLLFTLTQKKIGLLLRQPSFHGGLLVFLVLTGGYYLLREQYNPGYLHAVYENELGGRYLTTLEGHQYPFWFYYNNLHTWRFGYWFYFLLPAFIAGLVSRKDMIRKITLFNLLMTVPFWFIISLGGTKLDWYELPLYPFLCLQIGLLLHRAWNWLQGLINERKWKFTTAIFLFLLVFFIPFRGNVRRIFHFTEKPWDIEPHRQAYFLQDGIRQHKDLNNYTFCYSDYNGQLYYYISRLQAQPSGVQLFSNVDGLGPGRIVVISQPDLQTQLLQRYPVKKLDEKFGCTVYLVQTRP
jgi:4-amino-4-deoxy-L-arabinose transferase-like glycosyltransferase